MRTEYIKVTVNKIPFTKIEKEYQLTNDIFEGDPLAFKVLSTFSPGDQRLLILYAEEGNMRAIAKRFKVSDTAIRNKIKGLKKIFKERYNKWK